MRNFLEALLVGVQPHKLGFGVVTGAGHVNTEAGYRAEGSLGDAKVTIKSFQGTARLNATEMLPTLKRLGVQALLSLGRWCCNKAFTSSNLGVHARLWR